MQILDFRKYIYETLTRFSVQLTLNPLNPFITAPKSADTQALLFKMLKNK